MNFPATWESAVSFTCHFCKVSLPGELPLTKAWELKNTGSQTAKKLKITSMDLLEISLWIHVNLSIHLHRTQPYNQMLMIKSVTKLKKKNLQCYFLVPKAH